MRVVTWTSSARSHFGHFEDFFCTASLCSGHGFIRPAASGSVFWQNRCSCAWLPGGLHAQGGDVRKFLQVDLENINSPSCWGKIKLNIFEIMHADLTCQSTTKKGKVAALSGPAGVVHPKGVTSANRTDRAEPHPPNLRDCQQTRQLAGSCNCSGHYSFIGNYLASKHLGCET